MDKHCKDTFARISEEKQQRILDAAIAEFAAKGFSGANINVIASRADISIGAMYKYFGSKEALFLTIVERAHDLLAGVLDEVGDAPGDVYQKIEMLLRSAQQYARKFPELHQIYLDMTSEGLAHLSRKLSGRMETVSARFYEMLIGQAMAEGAVDKRVNARMAALCIDNLILMLQYSYTSDYFRERMKIFIGTDAFGDDEKIVRGMMRFIRGALSG